MKLSSFRLRPAASLALFLSAGAAAAGRAECPTPGPLLDVYAIGDTGERNLALYRNAIGVNKGVRSDAKNSALVFLGDNFYKFGLSDHTAGESDRLFKNIYGYFEPSFLALGRSSGLYPVRGENPPEKRPDDDCARVHAVAGNHDYYAESVSQERLRGLVPLGFSVAGNEYEARRKEWVYHYGEPAEAYWPFADPPLEGGRNGVHAIFIDSTILVRNPACPESQGNHPDAQCWNSARGRPEDCLSGDYRDRVGALLREMVKKHPGAWHVLFAHHPLLTVGEHGGARWRPSADGKGEVRLEDFCSRVHHPVNWAANSIDPEDACTAGYVAYTNFILDVIKDANIDAMVAGHDHSLQLLAPERFSQCEPEDPMKADASQPAASDLPAPPDAPLPPAAAAAPPTGTKSPAPLSPCHPYSARVDPARWKSGPRLHVVSGAGSKTSTVLMANGKCGRFTAPNMGKRRGASKPGFVRLRFKPDTLELLFFEGKSGRDVNKDMGGRSPFVLTGSRELQLDP